MSDAHPSDAWHRTMLAGKTGAEKELIEAFAMGRALNLSRKVRSKGRETREGKRRVRGTALRDLLVAAETDGGHARQMILVNACIVGELNLEYLRIETPIRLESCIFDDTIRLSEANLRSISLRNSDARRGIEGERMRVTGDLNLDEMRIMRSLRLAGAQLENNLHLTRSHILQEELAGRTSGPETSTHEDLLDLNGLKVGGRLFAAGLAIEGDFDMSGAHIESDVDLKAMQVKGQVRLLDSSMRNLFLNDMCAEYQDSALLMDRLTCSGSLFCGGEIKIDGGIHAVGLNIGASIYFDRGYVRAGRRDGDTPWAINMAQAHVHGDIVCAGELTIVGTFVLSYADVGGSLVLVGAKIAPVKGYRDGLVAFRIHIGHNLDCRQGFSCAGVTLLSKAQIDGGLKIDDMSELRTGLVASGLRVESNADVRVSGRVDLSQANVVKTATLDLSTLELSEDDQLSTDPILGDTPGSAIADLSGFTASVLRLIGRQPAGYLDLTGASVGLLLDDIPEWRPDEWVPRWIPAWVVDHSRSVRQRYIIRADVSHDSPVVLEGLEYQAVPAGADERLLWIVSGTQWTRGTRGERSASSSIQKAYCPAGVSVVRQPYMQLADVYQRNGRDSDSRDVLRLMHCRHNFVMNRRHHRLRRVWNSIQDLAIGYGYRPIRAVAWLLLISAAATAWIAGFDPEADVGPVQAAIASLGLALPGSGLDKIEELPELSVTGQIFAALLVVVSLTLGATVLAAIARAVKR